jgi:hypothetical protein
MIQFRPFRNNDPPGLANVWRSQPPLRGLAQRVNASLLEHFVFSKLYFDRNDLIVATDEDRIVGFVHVGFGPAADLSWMGGETGVLSLTMVVPRDDEDLIAGELLSRGERRLQDTGAKRLLGGECSPQCPFYLGLYGGCELPGILDSDERQARWLRQAGFQPTDQRLILQRRLADFRPVASREQLQIRRRFRVEVVMDPRPADWWRASQQALHDTTVFQLVPGTGGPAVAQATFRDMEPMGSSWEVQATGLLGVERLSATPESGIDVFVLGESLKQLQSYGIALVEAHVAPGDAGRQKLLADTGFQRVETGTVFTKDLADPP